MVLGGRNLREAMSNHLKRGPRKPLPPPARQDFREKMVVVEPETGPSRDTETGELPSPKAELDPEMNCCL